MMRFRVLCFAILAIVFLPVFLCAQSTSDASEAASLLQKSLATQTGGAAVTDIRLGGTFSFLPGSKQAKTGATVLTALADGTSQAVINLPSGTVTEVWSLSQRGPTITGTGPNGTITQAAGGDISMPSPAWFSPVLYTALVEGAGYASSYMGSETRNGATVNHVVVWQVPAQGSTLPAYILKAVTGSDIYLDPKTLLPASAVFRVRPYHPPGKPLSIHVGSVPEEVRYSNYQTVQGRTVPLHIQVYLGPKEIIDVTISSVAFNTGATITAPN